MNIFAHIRARLARSGLRAISAFSVAILALCAVLVTPSSGAAAPGPELALAGEAISLSVTCGEPAATVTFTGTGFAAGTPVHVHLFRPNGDGLSIGEDKTPNTSGTFTGSFTFDASGLPAVKFLVSQTTSPYAELAEAWYFVKCAEVRSNPQLMVARPGTQGLIVSFFDFAVDIPIALELPGSTLTPAEITPTAANPTGTTPVTLNQQPPCTPGQVTWTNLKATQATYDDPPIVIGFAPGAPKLAALPTGPRGPDRVVEVSLAMLCPTVTVSQNPIADTNLPRNVSIGGSGWAPDAPVSLTVNGVQMAEGTPNGGILKFSGTVPQLDCGTYDVVATQTIPANADTELPPVTTPLVVTAKTPLTITCSKTAVTATPNPVVETAGPQLLDVTVEGFPAGRPVKLAVPGVTMSPDEVDPTATVPTPVTLNKQPPCGRTPLTATQAAADPTKPPKTAQTFLEVLCARLTATPNTVTDVLLPEDVKLDGTGFVFGTPITVTFDDANPVVVDPVNEDGSFTTTRSIPRTLCGPHKLTATQTEAPPPTPTPSPSPTESGPVIKLRSFAAAAAAAAAAPLVLHADAIVNVACSTPFVSLRPQVMVQKPGPAVTDVSLSGFAQGRPVTLGMPGVVLDPTAITPTRTDPGKATVKLDKQPACGENTLTAHQVIDDADGPLDRTATTAVMLFCPTFTPTPAKLPDTALPGKVGATGTNWVPNMPVQLLLDGKKVAEITPDDKGVVNATPALPRSGCGVHPIEAVQVVGTDADPKQTHLPVLLDPVILRVPATLTVTCTPAFLALDPPVITDGTTTTASGVGFVPGRTVRLVWTYLDGTPLDDACTATTSAGGTFVVTCLVLPNTALGTRQLRAVETVPAGDPVAARTGIAELLVVPGSMTRKQDGDFLERS